MKLLIKLAILAIIILCIELSIQSVEKRECRQWQSTPRIFAEWQIAQCEYHQIELK